MSPWAVTSTRPVLDYILPPTGSPFFNAKSALNFVFLLLSGVIEWLFSSTSLSGGLSGGLGFLGARLHGCTCCGQWSQCLRGQHLLARLLCGCLCGAAGITGRPFTPAQTAIRSPSPSPALSSIIPLLRFSPNPPCVPDCRRPHFILYIHQPLCLSVCASASVWPPPFPFPSFWLCLPPPTETQTAAAATALL